MFENLDIFRMSASLAQHAGLRQAVVSQNVANADTPGYVARGVPDFAAVFEGAGTGGTVQRATRPGHLHGQREAGETPIIDMKGEASPNGNQVSVENEILQSVNAKRDHDRALAIYKSGLTVLRSTLRT